MDLTKVYYDSEGSPRNIYQMVDREPEWAANRIQEGQKAIEAIKNCLEFLLEYNGPLGR